MNTASFDSPLGRNKRHARYHSVAQVIIRTVPGLELPASARLSLQVVETA